eukprot:2880317-Prymnesium_polylepis.1
MPARPLGAARALLCFLAGAGSTPLRPGEGEGNPQGVLQNHVHETPPWASSAQPVPTSWPAKSTADAA